MPDMRGAIWKEVDRYESVPDARRFEYWEMSPALLLGSRAATAYALALGLDWIENRVKSLADFTRNRLADIPGMRVLDIGAERCGIVTAWHPAWGDPKKLSEFLLARRINARTSPQFVAQIDFPRKGVAWALRLSPHYFNTEAEIETAVAAVRDFSV